MSELDGITGSEGFHALLRVLPYSFASNGDDFTAFAMVANKVVDSAVVIFASSGMLRAFALTLLLVPMVSVRGEISVVVIIIEAGVVLKGSLGSVGFCSLFLCGFVVDFASVGPAHGSTS